MTIAEAKRMTRINEWRQLIDGRQQSGQSVREWCRENGIRENSYYYWLRIIREKALCDAGNRTGTLVRVEPKNLAAEIVSPQTSYERIVIRAYGVETEFSSCTDIEHLAAFVKALSHTQGRGDAKGAGDSDPQDAQLLLSLGPEGAVDAVFQECGHCRAQHHAQHPVPEDLAKLKIKIVPEIYALTAQNVQRLYSPLSYN